MSPEIPYDVAISFLYQDLNLAKALYDELCKGLKVFFYPRNQEELAGTDGLESMGEPFRNESLLNLVLYRPKWGKTPWTAVEEAAIKDSCLKTGFKSLFFFSIEPTKDLPKWLPETHVRFNYADFSLEQAVGGIKLRAQERGSHIQPLTPARKAEILKAEDDYRQEKAYLLSSDKPIFKEVEALFAEVVKQCDIVNAGGHFEIKSAVKTKYRDLEQFCSIGLVGEVSMGLCWYQPYAGSLERASLTSRQFDTMIILPPNYVHFRPPNVLRETQYSPDVSRAREYGWRLPGKDGSFISSKDLASRFVIEFLDFVEQKRRRP
jgi:hypothetical protein